MTWIEDRIASVDALHDRLAPQFPGVTPGTRGAFWHALAEAWTEGNRFRAPYCAACGNTGDPPKEQDET